MLPVDLDGCMGASLIVTAGLTTQLLDWDNEKAQIDTCAFL